ncbi:UDP-glucose flavonoid 3-O-glucosyltransferase 7 [Morus notabilis]|uniref:UDP-glucose flavonoid 3-O-glucosyltransferase 7 n=1 Tax=Morus notabilis TaxID=981085 RepID=W9RY75_9ROSA|nr:UDP-glucose flavonoid 3-O-glucosyltransferase 7 [Morus notabilis]EXC17293.1 UDP-glucose flavonoid 3-O-glucosyltransferase 7 [Morus notabilis]
MNTTKTSQLHIFFFPYLAHGRTIPALDIANLFASRGFKTTIILTPVNASIYAKTIERSRNLGLQIRVLLIKFPAEEFRLPKGCEIARLATTNEMLATFHTATIRLEHPLEQLIAEHRPDCLVADSLFTWATRVAARFGITRLEFDGTNFFSMCASMSMNKYQPHKKVSSESEPFVIPNLPHEIKLTRDQLPFFMKQDSDQVPKREDQAEESELASYGVIVNSFYELERDYADHYRRVLGRKAWHIGPTCLFYKDEEGKAQRGDESFNTDKHECLTWLDSKEPNSVVYVCFGSVVNFSDAQLMEIALGLEASGKQFILVVRKARPEGSRKEEWLPEGFEKRVEGRGLIIRNWAPQVLILEHEAVGGIVTHCGWNSILEGICAGVPMVTWPVMADQFYNEKLVVQILRIGVGVGAKKWARFVGDNVRREALEKALNQLMEGEEAEKMRSRAKVLAGKASKAFEKGGSSFSDFNALIEELLKLRRSA